MIHADESAARNPDEREDATANPDRCSEGKTSCATHPIPEIEPQDDPAARGVETAAVLTNTATGRHADPNGRKVAVGYELSLRENAVQTSMRTGEDNHYGVCPHIGRTLHARPQRRDVLHFRIREIVPRCAPSVGCDLQVPEAAGSETPEGGARSIRSRTRNTAMALPMPPPRTATQ